MTNKMVLHLYVSMQFVMFLIISCSKVRPQHGFYQVAILLGKINITVSLIFINDIMLAWLENKIDLTLNNTIRTGAVYISHKEISNKWVFMLD